MTSNPNPTSPIEEHAHDKGSDRNLTVAFVLPLMIALGITMFYPDVAESYEVDEGEPPILEVTSEVWWYLGLVSSQVIAVMVAVGYFWSDYVRQFPFRVSWLSVPVGIIGVFLWVVLTQLGLEDPILQMLGFDLSRPSFNPFVIQSMPVFLAFMSIRFLLLTLANPMAEELFVRGWLVRWVDDPDFEHIRLNQLSTLALISASLYGIVSHPGEAIAAFVWFGLVTLLMRHTGNLWDCFVAHAITNFLLGVYVIQFQQWQLW